jgi:hypothetical protein
MATTLDTDHRIIGGWQQALEDAGLKKIQVVKLRQAMQKPAAGEVCFLPPISSPDPCPGAA